MIEDGGQLEEISAPELTLPSGIHAEQIKKHFTLGDLSFALVLQSSLNVYLPGIEEKETTFSGVLISREGSQKWGKWVELKDQERDVKNNPYYLFVDEGVLNMTVVDNRGGGSGEGVMYLMALESQESWNLKGCYYFGHNYADPLMSGDYYAHSTLLEEQLVEPMSTCKYLEIS